MMKECPCRDCKEREVGCHGYCEPYKVWKEEQDELNAKIREKSNIEYLARPGKKVRVKKKC